YTNAHLFRLLFLIRNWKLPVNDLLCRWTKRMVNYKKVAGNGKTEPVAACWKLPVFK
ncbi:MAG: hypothetical protein ACI9R7_002746, partial [Lysobacterales bacterium]